MNNKPYGQYCLLSSYNSRLHGVIKEEWICTLYKLIEAKDKCPVVIKSSATCETTPTRNWIKATTDVLLEVRKEGCFDFYDGGQLIVKFDFSGSDNSSYFDYADCIHEVKPVTQGYHLCLVYNLMYKGLGVCPAPVDHQQQVKEIVSAMKYFLYFSGNAQWVTLKCLGKEILCSSGRKRL